MLSVSITSGAMALTRGSAAPVSHVVQPRFEPPETMKSFTGFFHSCLANSCKASIARTRLLTIGNKSGQLSSFVFRWRTKVSAMRASSFLTYSSRPARACGAHSEAARTARTRTDDVRDMRYPSHFRMNPGFTVRPAQQFVRLVVADDLLLFAVPVERPTQLHGEVRQDA